MGFTLIEILCVVVVIGILAGISIPAVQGIIARSDASRALSHLQMLASAKAQYKAVVSDAAAFDGDSIENQYLAIIAEDRWRNAPGSYSLFLEETGPWRPQWSSISSGFYVQHSVTEVSKPLNAIKKYADLPSY
jgi:prepilin-type N-terminal cleavage/methylation domain-containing protein